MELKEYQKKTLEQVKIYLESLAEFKGKYEKAIAVDPDLAIDFPFKAWEKTVGTSYHSSKNGLGEPLPDFYLKIPTGGGKTILTGIAGRMGLCLCIYSYDIDKPRFSVEHHTACRKDSQTV